MLPARSVFFPKRVYAFKHSCFSLILLSCFLLNAPTKAQEFLNLDFEYQTPNHYPRIWQTNEGTGAYLIQVDSTVAYSGRRSLRLTAQNSPMLLAGLLFPVERLRGKRVTLSGYIRTDSLQNGTAQLIYYDYGRRKLEMAPASATGTTSWQLFSFTFPVSVDSQGEGIVIGLKVNGTGKVYLDKVSITLDGQPLTDAPFVPKELSASELQWLNKRAMPIQSLDPEHPSTDLRPLQKIIGKARIVALGENSHGSGTIFKMKHRLLKFMVEEMGFAILAMEAPAPEAERINEYVLTGKGSLEQVVQYLGFKSWQTHEVLAMIKWMRDYNQTHKVPIQFKGFDIQSRQVALENLTSFLQQHDPGKTALLDSIKTILQKEPLPESERKMAYQKAQRLFTLLNAYPNNYYTGLTPSAFNQIKFEAQILTQNIGLPMFKHRRQSMAENIQWLLEKAEPGTKMVIWAHNDHVAKTSESMGHYLAKRYSPDYLPIGFTFNRGQYAAYGSEKYYPVQPAYPNTYEYYLNKVRFPNFALDVRKAPKETAGRWLTQPFDFRSLGAEPQLNQFKQTDLLQYFDVVIFLKESQAATYLQP